MLTEMLVLLQILYFVMNGFQRTSFIYRDACGLFWKGKIRPVATAVLNIVISVVLVQYIGLAGVILGTILSWLLTTWWYDPKMIYENAFHRSAKKYFWGYGKAAAVTALLWLVTVWLGKITALTGILLYGYRLLLCLVIPNAGYYLVYHHSEEYRYLKNMVLGIIKKRK